MSLLGFLYALLFQMNGAELHGNAWWDKMLDLTLQNVKAIQGVFGWIALGLIVIVVILFVISAVKGNEFSLATAGCLGTAALISGLVWLVGLLHIFILNYLASNFTVAAGGDQGFWVLLVILALISWS